MFVYFTHMKIFSSIKNDKKNFDLYPEVYHIVKSRRDTIKK